MKCSTRRRKQVSILSFRIDPQLMLQTDLSPSVDVAYWGARFISTPKPDTGSEGKIEPKEDFLASSSLVEQSTASIPLVDLTMDGPRPSTTLEHPHNYAHGRNNDAYSTMVRLKVGDTAKILQYYRCALEYLGQENCKKIVTAFIDVIEPGKKTNHPYSGGEKTKPQWWPAKIEYKRPHELGKKSKEAASLK